MIKNYLLVAWKILLRRKFFTFISLFGICFTLTTLLVVSALLDYAFVAKAPESAFSRVLMVQRVTTTSPDGSSVRTSPPGYGLIEKHIRVLRGAEKVGVYARQQQVTVYQHGSAVKLVAKQTDAAFWDILDFHFIEGRPFTYDEEQRATPVVVINTAMRDKLFHGQSALNNTVVLEGKTFRVVGIVENVAFLRSSAYADVWMPISTMQPEGYKEQLHGPFTAIVLAKHTSDLAQLKEEYQEQLKKVVFPDPKKFNTITSTMETKVEAIAWEIFSSDGNAVQNLFAFVAFFAMLFLMLPAVNLININMSRIMERSSEIGVRKSFGASSSILAGQFIVENLVLVGMGGVLSLLLAWLLLAGIEYSGVIAYAEFQLNYRMFLYALVASLFFTVLSGVYPAWRMSRMHPVAALKGGVA